jgi:hypothetical protein
LENHSRTQGLANVNELVGKVKSEFGRAQAALAPLMAK